MNGTIRNTLIVAMTFAALMAMDRPVLAQWRSVPITRTLDGVAPWTGIVLWTDHDKNQSDAIQLEYTYVRYDAVALEQGTYDWSSVDSVLDEVAGRGHQAILRFYFVYPGKPSSVPTFIKSMGDYKTLQGKSEGKKTGFVDWSHPAIEQFTLDFYSAFARRYDTDARLAYLQTGFGLWGEYHLYDGPLTGAKAVGKIFPSKKFQYRFLKHLRDVFHETPWMISVDAADSDYAPFEDHSELLEVPFGLFDDSFLCKPHPQENALNWRFFGGAWKRTPAGGEFSYYTRRDQKRALSSNGPNGRSFADSAAEFHITFMIGNDQPEFQTMKRIEEAGQMTGYRFRIVAFETSAEGSRVTVANDGVAPPYHDAFVTIDGVRSRDSLRGLLPGKSRTFHIAAGGLSPNLIIDSDRLVTGMTIPFEANLK